LELANIVELLREHSFRITPQRIAIVKYILNTESHPSAEEIHKIIQKKYPMVSLATVYKTLDLLKKLNIIQELGFADEGTRYETNDRRHVNMVCISCGRINDIEEDYGLSELETQVRAKSNYYVLSRRFELYGYCPDCKSKVKSLS
jgi:Fur family transcriptional regulator, peroxide stress response regulator